MKKINIVLVGLIALIVSGCGDMFTPPSSRNNTTAVQVDVYDSGNYHAERELTPGTWPNLTRITDKKTGHSWILVDAGSGHTAMCPDDDSPTSKLEK